MSFLSAVFLYFLIWWVMLFTVLPLGVERNADEGLGHDAGAPRVHGLKRKIFLNTVLSAAILAIIYVLAETGMIDWKGFFRGDAS